LIYYYDRQFGGFDRVISAVRGKSPGTNQPGKSTNAVSSPAKQTKTDPNVRENVKK
jgi:hypothetical protein